jgi:hypothetical protein
MRRAKRSEHTLKLKFIIVGGDHMVKVNITCPYVDCGHAFDCEIPEFYNTKEVKCPDCNKPIKLSKPAGQSRSAAGQVGSVERLIDTNKLTTYMSSGDPGGYLGYIRKE